MKKILTLSAALSVFMAATIALACMPKPGSIQGPLQLRDAQNRVVAVVTGQVPDLNKGIPGHITVAVSPAAKGKEIISVALYGNNGTSRVYVPLERHGRAYDASEHLLPGVRYTLIITAKTKSTGLKQQLALDFAIPLMRGTGGCGDPRQIL